MKGTLLLAVLPAVGSLSVMASTALPEGFGTTPIARFNVSADAGYRQPAKAMAYLVAKTSNNDRRNHFCVVGYQWASGNEQAWVFWEEERTLKLLDPSLYADTRLKALTMARRNLKLGRDTVATENDINGSTYIVTVDWWISIADDCRKHGEQYEIEPFRIVPSKTGDPR